MSVVAKVPSLTRKGVAYEIDLRNGTPYCDCPAASFRKVGSPICKHRSIYETARAAILVCRAAHNEHGSDVLCQQCLIDLLATLAAEVEKTKRKKRR